MTFYSSSCTEEYRRSRLLVVKLAAGTYFFTGEPHEACALARYHILFWAMTRVLYSARAVRIAYNLAGKHADDQPPLRMRDVDRRTLPQVIHILA